MYSSRPNLYIGFHGCDVTVRNGLVTNPGVVKISQELHDWLGHGFYVWENNYERAEQWAKDKEKRDKTKTFKPAVLGVVYQLNNCLDFTDSASIDILPDYYKAMKDELEFFGDPLPQNKNVKDDEYKDQLLRNRDCAVIEFIHADNSRLIAADKAKQGYSDIQPFDTTRGLFTEGGPAFEGAGIRKKNHIQICIRNLNCIKAFFIPRTEVKLP